MPVLGPAADRINRDVAGLTHVAGDHTPPPGAPQAATAQEIFHESTSTEFGGLAHIFSDPVHLVDTTLPIGVDTSLPVPTTSVVGRLRGLRPNPHDSQHAPGPNQGNAPQPGAGWLPPVATPPPGGWTFLPLVTRARKWLGL